jgi:hypothetical protein
MIYWFTADPAHPESFAIRRSISSDQNTLAARIQVRIAWKAAFR